MNEVNDLKMLTTDVAGLMQSIVPIPINQGVSIMNEVNDLKMLTTDVAGLGIQSCRYLLIREESS